MSDARLPLEHPSVLEQVTALPPVTGPTPSQTVGPYFGFGFEWMQMEDLVAAGSPGAVTLRGRVIDGAGELVGDALVEIWQPDASGSLEAGSEWTGFGRCLTDADGSYRFTTVRPGPAEPGSAPFIDVSVFARGLLNRLVTRVYLPGEAANDADPVLQGLDEERRRTLVAEQHGDDLVFDVRLQGERETVFFAW